VRCVFQREVQHCDLLHARSSSSVFSGLVLIIRCCSTQIHKFASLILECNESTIFSNL